MYKAKSEFRFIGKLVFNLNDIVNRRSVKAAYFDYSKGTKVEVSVYVDSDYNSAYFYDHRWNKNLTSNEFLIIYDVFPNLRKQFNDLVISFRRDEMIDKLLEWS